jgi:plasmid stability protein
MANLTLAVPEDVLQRAREAALREHTSVNALVREFLTQYVDAKSRRLQALDSLDALAAATDSRSARRWTRASLHRR